uniref:PARP catalytic domain-containing protein n=1 Tax=Alexandrium andersonii TaxID=327968 RepID=A0A7S2N1V4_9DINO|mmetsp:Transcript_81591/g.182394  ORF Transcript_81591/g.182394 Transcript_81591/m.182394 type:complete len:164 (+) Transcript_81591:47-538(+)
MSTVCIRPNCGRRAFQGKPGNFCGRTCMAAGPPNQPASEEDDPLPDARDGAPFEAFHGTSFAIAQAVAQSRFTLSEQGNLGKGVYFAGMGKARRFAEQKFPDQPALLRCRIRVNKAKYVDGDDTTWQGDGFDACRAEFTSLSARPEWCILNAISIEVLEVIRL